MLARVPFARKAPRTAALDGLVTSRDVSAWKLGLRDAVGREKRARGCEPDRDPVSGSQTMTTTPDDGNVAGRESGSFLGTLPDKRVLPSSASDGREPSAGRTRYTDAAREGGRRSRRRSRLKPDGLPVRLHREASASECSELTAG